MKLVAAIGFACLAGAVLASPASASWAPQFESGGIHVGSWPKSVGVGDVTGDGRGDVVVANNFYLDPTNDFTLQVLAQQPDHSLARVATYPLEARNVGALTVADLNNDGLSDVAVAVEGGIDRFYQQVDGTLDGPDVLPTAMSRTYRLVYADVFRDGRPDYLMAGDLGTVLMRATPDGTYVPKLLGKTPNVTDTAVGNLNDDGLPDVVTSGLGRAAVHYQRPDGNYDTVEVLDPPDSTDTTSTYGVAVADISGDGRDDVTLVNSGNRPSSKVYVLLQRADGTLAPATERSTYDIPAAIQAADLDGDHRNDIVVGHDGWSEFTYYLQDAAGVLGSEQHVRTTYGSLGPAAMAVGDFSCDGRPDVAIGIGSDGHVVLSRQKRPEDLALDACPPVDPVPSEQLPPADYDPGAPAPSDANLLPTLPSTVGGAIPPPTDGVDPTPKVGDIFETQDGRLIEVDPATGVQRLVSSNTVSKAVGGLGLIEHPTDIAVGDDGTVYLTDDSAEAVIGIDPVTGRQRLVSDNTLSAGLGGATLLENPSAVATLRDGNIVVASETSGYDPDRIVEVDPLTGRQTLISSNDKSTAASGVGDLDLVHSLAETPDGFVIYADYYSDSNSNGVGNIGYANRATGALRRLASSSLFDGAGHIDMDPNGVLLIPVSDDSVSVLGMDVVHGGMTTVVPRLDGDYGYPRGIGDVGVEPDGTLILADSNGLVVAYDRSSQTQSVISKWGFLRSRNPLVVDTPAALAVYGEPRAVVQRSYWNPAPPVIPDPTPTPTPTPTPKPNVTPAAPGSGTAAAPAYGPSGAGKPPRKRSRCRRKPVHAAAAAPRKRAPSCSAGLKRPRG